MGRDIPFEYKQSHLGGNIFTLKKIVLTTLREGKGNKDGMLRRLYNFWEIKGCPQMVSEEGRIVLEERSDESEKWDTKEKLSHYINSKKIFDLLKRKQRQ